MAVSTLFGSDSSGQQLIWIGLRAVAERGSTTLFGMLQGRRNRSACNYSVGIWPAQSAHSGGITA